MMIMDRKECNYIITIYYMVLYLTFIFSTFIQSQAQTLGEIALFFHSFCVLLVFFTYYMHNLKIFQFVVSFWELSQNCNIFCVDQRPHKC